MGKEKTKFVLLFICILIFELLFLYFLKYRNQNLLLLNLNVLKIGNFINLFIALTAIVGALIVFLKFEITFAKKRKLFALKTCSSGFLIFALLYSVFISQINGYFLGYPVSKIIVAAIFLAYQYFSFVFIIYIFLIFFHSRNSLLLKACLYSLVGFIVLTVLSMLYSLDSIDDSKKYLSLSKKAHVVVVLGAAVWSNNEPSPILAARVRKALKFYEIGAAKKILVTGGAAPGEISEARAAFNLLIRLGVEKDYIIIEESTSSTADQIEYIKRTIIEAENMKNVLIVSDQFHLKRVSEICKFYEVEADIASSDLIMKWSSWIYYKLRDSAALLLFLLFAI